MPWLVAAGLIIAGAAAMWTAVFHAQPEANQPWVPIAWLGGGALIVVGIAIVGWELFGMAVKYWVHC